MPEEMHASQMDTHSASLHKGKIHKLNKETSVNT